ncbi:MAG: tetratricopeptide repeat protein [Streptomycetaceae bacterium]|nr:tetratricopeptide repeat protein [Streptomycetaceae bacterium]
MASGAAALGAAALRGEVQDVAAPVQGEAGADPQAAQVLAGQASAPAEPIAPTCGVGAPATGVRARPVMSGCDADSSAAGHSAGTSAEGAAGAEAEGRSATTLTTPAGDSPQDTEAPAAPPAAPVEAPVEAAAEVETSAGAEAAVEPQTPHEDLPEPELPTAAGSEARWSGVLPEGPPYFTGRRRELRQLRGEIDRPGLDILRGKLPRSCRVLLVAGRPGSGRTSLAVRLAQRLAERYPDGQFFARITDGGGRPVPMERIVGELFGPSARRQSRLMPYDPAAVLRAAVANRRVILVLDDVTHANQLLPLLLDEPGCLVIATSEGPLPGIPDIRPCTLGGLDTVACAELLAHTIGSTRVTCDPTAVEALAEACAGNPTALRLIGGWLAVRPGTSVTDTVLVLSNVPDDTAAAAVTSPPVARAFRLVHDTMGRLAARLLRMLACAPEGIVDAHIASSLAGCALGEAQSALADFVRYGLLYPDGDVVPQTPQYRLPRWLRPLLTHLVAACERPTELRLARARMLERTVRLLQSCRGVAEPPGSPARALVQELPRALRFPSADVAACWLRRRLPVLLGAARAAAADGELDTLARRLIAALVRALETYGGNNDATSEASELYELHGLALSLAERRALPRDKAAALINLADLDAAADRTQKAIERYRAALDAARAGEDGSAAGRALEALGKVYLALGDGLRAADWYDRALVLRQSQGDLAGQARLHGRLGALHTIEQQYEAALREWRAAAALYRRLHDHAGHGRALAELSRVQEYAGYPEEALRTVREALHCARKVGDAELEGAALLRMAETLERLGDPAGAALQRVAVQGLPAARAQVRSA